MKHTRMKRSIEAKKLEFNCSMRVTRTLNFSAYATLRRKPNSIERLAKEKRGGRVLCV